MIIYKDTKVVDKVSSYFGMREISIEGDKIYLNNQPLYQKLILDQGYWPETSVTPPLDQALKRDVELIKEMGFNGARKHQKIEDDRFYYWLKVLPFRTKKAGDMVSRFRAKKNLAGGLMI